MKKIFLIGFGLIILIILIFSIRFIFGGPEDSWICDPAFGWIKHGKPSESAPTTPCGSGTKGQIVQTITYKNASVDLITVELPFPGAITGKDFSVIGKARGTWFFEASFPIQVLDKDGNVFVAVPAQAQKDPATGEVNWMTENFVPFKADIKIPESYIGPATLILKKDNPSGLPANDASISFPITIEY
jgi:hypothetical protein